jgi:hypothetical protein
MSVAYDAQFQHEPLDLRQAATIRLIEILPTGPGDTVACRVRHTTTEALYTCLSYVWGSSTDTKTIHMNGKPFQVRENLWNFLRTASSAETGSWNTSHETGFSLDKAAKSIWVDALCIDQDNNGERNHQVQQMGEIFSSAQRVIAWMGSNSQYATLFRYMREDLTTQLFFDVSYYLPLYDFCKDCYWRRAWITQEVQLARHVILLANNEAIDLAYLQGEFQRTINRTFGQVLHTELWGPIGDTASQKDQRALMENMYHFRHKQCSNPLDLIYSLLSISLDGANLRVEYNIGIVGLARNVLQTFREDLCLWRVGTVLDILQITKHHDYAATNRQLLNTSYNWTQPFMELRAKRFKSNGSCCDDCNVAISLTQYPGENMREKTYIHCLSCTYTKPTSYQSQDFGHLILAEAGPQVSGSIDNKIRWRLFRIMTNTDTDDITTSELESGPKHLTMALEESHAILRLSISSVCQFAKSAGVPQPALHLRSGRNNRQTHRQDCGWKLI